MRKRIVVGNWKMYTTSASAVALASEIVQGLGAEDRVTVAVCPPFPYLSFVSKVLQGSRVGLGAQNMYPEKGGAFTGEVSPAMLLDLVCRLLLEKKNKRRHKLSKTDAFIHDKLRFALSSRLQVIRCVCENLQ